MSLRGKQKRFLRSKAHHLQPIFQIGKGGINSAMIVQIEEALEKRELIKVSLLQNTDEIAEEAAQVLEKEIDCEIVPNHWTCYCIIQTFHKRKVSKAIKRSKSNIRSDHDEYAS